MFLDYLTYYKIDNKEYKNTIKTKSRKLSSLKSFFKFCYDKDRIKKDPASKVKSPKIHEKPIIRFDKLDFFWYYISKGDENSDQIGLYYRVSRRA